MATARSAMPSGRRRRLVDHPLVVYNDLAAAQEYLEEKKWLAAAATPPISNERSALNDASLPSFLGGNDTTTYTTLQGINLDLEEPTRATYSTSFFLVVLLLVIFLFQWNAKRSRKQVLVSYRVLAQKKQFYKFWLALLSHPPLDIGRQGSSPIRASYVAQSTVDMGNVDTTVTTNSSIQQTFVSVLERVRTKAVPILEPLIRGHASGLPLLIYNSHIVWSCRALEVKYNQNDAFHYARVLLALAILAIAVELALTYGILQSKIFSIGRSRFQSIQPNDMADAIHRLRRKLIHRDTGTFTVVATALLLVFRTEFLHVPLQMLPILPNPPFLFNDPAWTCTICVLILMILSNKGHYGLSVLTGSVVGMAWSTGCIAFLADLHFGNWLVAIVIGMSLLSLKADPQMAVWVPCIDHVAWDQNGHLIPVEGQRWIGALSEGDEEPINEPDDDDEEDHSGEDTEAEDDAFDVEATRRTSPRLDNADIYGRVPEMDDDFEDAGEDVALTQSSSNIIRSRRGAGPTRV